jgi:hypothetical protein
MRAPTFTEKLLAYHTRFERHLLLLQLHGEDRTEHVLPGPLAAKLRQQDGVEEKPRGLRPRSGTKVTRGQAQQAPGGHHS